MCAGFGEEEVGSNGRNSKDSTKSAEDETEKEEAETGQEHPEAHGSGVQTGIPRDMHCVDRKGGERRPSGDPAAAADRTKRKCEDSHEPRPQKPGRDADGRTEAAAGCKGKRPRTDTKRAGERRGSEG